MDELNLYNSPNVAKKIKQHAKDKNISLKQLLINCQLGPNTFSHMLHGRAIAFDSLAKIADYLECSVDYLLGRTDEPTGETYLNSKEKKLIAAYRNKPDMQKSVDVLLGVTEGEFKGEIIGEQEKTNVAKIAAFGGGISTKVYKDGEIDEEEIRKLVKEREVKDNF